eukprot:scaffold186986_cov26-Prasinocladus_malaysianus.AAC.1
MENKKQFLIIHTVVLVKIYIKQQRYDAKCTNDMSRLQPPNICTASLGPFVLDIKGQSNRKTAKNQGSTWSRAGGRS